VVGEALEGDVIDGDGALLDSSGALDGDDGWI
jgi:hypothetical protein